MSGGFEGLTDVERELFRNIFPCGAHGGRSRPAAHPRNILNSLLYVLTAGCRRRGLPRGPRRASESSSRRRLKSWHEDGTLNEIKARPPGPAQNEGLIRRTSGAADGSFSPWERRRR